MLLEGNVYDANDFLSDLLATWYVGENVACEAAAPDDNGDTSCQAVVLEGESEIHLEVTDPDGATGSDTVVIDLVLTDTPEVTIEEPTEDGAYYADVPTAFSALVTDGEDASDDLVVSWSSDLDGELDVANEPGADGIVTGELLLSEGVHALELSAEDSIGKVGTASVEITVRATNTLPECQLTEPADGSSGEEGVEITFRAVISDDDVLADKLSVAWSSNLDGDLGLSDRSGSGDDEYDARRIQIKVRQDRAYWPRKNSRSRSPMDCTMNVGRP